MGPVTTAGGLAQCFAEAMFCVALGQLARPGSPVILGNFLSSISLKSGAPTFGTPEPALAYFAIGQLARRLGVALRCGGNLCASKVPDAQAAYERRQFTVAGVPRRGEFHPARGRLAGGGTGHVV
jgi:trimethylamine--corrinoid protein Co-methyltransferase